MRTGYTFVASLVLALSAPQSFAQSVILRETADARQVLEIVVGGPLDMPLPATVTLSGASGVIKSGQVTPVAAPDGQHVLLSLPLDGPVPDARKLIATVTSGGVKWLDEVPVVFELTFDFSTEPGRQCSGGISLLLSGDPKNPPADELWGRVLAYVFGVDPKTVSADKNDWSRAPDNIGVRVSEGGVERPMAVRRITSASSVGAAQLAGQLPLCLNVGEGVPAGSFNIELTFRTDGPPLPLALPLKGEKIAGSGSSVVENGSAKPGTVGARPRERNLDLGVSFTSSKPAEASRINRGVLDLRFAPWLNWRRPKGPSSITQEWFPFWTPVYVDANIATGDITKETLSLNRVLFSSEIEFRLVPIKTLLPATPGGAPSKETGHYITSHRFLIGARHGSDRDFEQLEATAYGEWRPLFGSWNRPRQANWVAVPDPITGKNVFKFSNYGWEVKPVVGFEVGRTYERLNPAAVVLPSPTVRRLYGGLDIKFNLSPYATLAVTDTLYMRGELASKRVKNYLKIVTEFPLNRPGPGAVQGVFASFERGNLPPFTSPDVNSITVGYRIRASGWGGFDR